MDGWTSVERTGTRSVERHSRRFRPTTVPPYDDGRLWFSVAVVPQRNQAVAKPGRRETVPSRKGAVVRRCSIGVVRSWSCSNERGGPRAHPALKLQPGTQ